MKGRVREALLLGLVGGSLVLLSGCALLDLLQLPPVPPAAPTQVAASLGELEHAVRITWQPVEGADLYQLYRATAEDGEYQPIGDTDSTTYYDERREDHPVLLGTLYWYRVQACNDVGCSELSQPVAGYAGYPPAPTGVQASDGTYPDKIVVGWDPVPGATNYQIYRDPGIDPESQGLCFLTIVEAPATNYTDTQVRAGLRYTYKLRACNAYGCSNLSPGDFGCVAPCPVP